MIYDTIIIGAGITGLRAAQRILEEGGYPLIVEATAVLGGRIRTIDGINHGAGWFHMHDEDLLLEVAKSLGLAVTYDSAKNPVYYFNGQRQEPEFREKLMGFINEGIQKALAADPASDVSFDDILRGSPFAVLAEHLRRVWSGARQDRACSLRDAASDPGGPGGYILTEGMGSLIDKIVGALPPDILRTNAPVTAVTRDGEDYVVRTADGELLKARSVIATCSVGVLQSGRIDLREVLSPAMQQALSSDNITMGSMNKVAFKLDDDFLRRNPHLENGHFDLTDHHLFVHTGFGGKPLITVFYGGEDADRLEQMSMEDIKQEILEAFQSTGFLGDEIAALAGLTPLVTRWGSEPYCEGAYSTLMVGGERPMAPLQNDAFFYAGEAVSPFPCHVSGAYRSGEMAADALISWLGLRPAVREENLLEKLQELALTLAGSAAPGFA